MIRYLKYAFLAALGLLLLVVALANREVVTLRLLPVEMGGFLGFNWAIDLPLFLVVFAGIVAGLLIGFVWEWLREHKHRAEAATAKREAAKLERQVSELKAKADEPKDEILALLEQPRKAS